MKTKLQVAIFEKYGSQRRFAEELGVTPATLSYKLRNLPSITVEEAARMLELLDMKVCEDTLSLFTE